jgi:hypothetical protein
MPLNKMIKRKAWRRSILSGCPHQEIGGLLIKGLTIVRCFYFSAVRVMKREMGIISLKK